MIDKRIILSKDCYITTIESNSFVLNFSNGKYYKLNQTSKYIWDLIEKGFAKHEDILEQVMNEYDVEESIAKDSIKNIITQFYSNDLIKYIDAVR